MSILDLTAVELGKKIKLKEITAVEATKAALAQIKAVLLQSMRKERSNVHKRFRK